MLSNPLDAGAWRTIKVGGDEAWEGGFCWRWGEDEDGVDGDRVGCHLYWGGDGYIGKWLTGETERTEVWF